MGSYLPNPYGLHDVLGNVFEWCADPWPFSEGAAEVVGAASRVIRGGSWTNRAYHLRVDWRIGAPESTRRSTVGVRPVRRIVPAG